MMDGLTETVTNFLGKEQKQQKSELKHTTLQEFADDYGIQVANALEQQDYRQAESLAEETTDFGEVIEDYVGFKLAAGTVALEMFEEQTQKASELINECAKEIKTAKNSRYATNMGKQVAKAQLKRTKSHVAYLNSDNTTETMRTAFKAFNQVAQAAHYTEQKEDINLEQYDPQKVKAMASKKALQLQDLDEEMGLNFKVPEYRKLTSEYQKL